MLDLLRRRTKKRGEQVLFSPSLIMTNIFPVNEGGQWECQSSRSSKRGTEMAYSILQIWRNGWKYFAKLPVK